MRIEQVPTRKCNKSLLDLTGGLTYSCSAADSHIFGKHSASGMRST